MSPFITISAVGDIMLGDSHYCIGRGVRSTFLRKEHGGPFQHVLEIFQQSEIVIGNLEAVLSDKGRREALLSSIQYRGSSEFVSYLSEANISIMSVANNHTLDHGTVTYEDTVCQLNKAGIESVGIRLTERMASQDEGVYREVKGIRVCFLSFCLNAEPSTRPIVATAQNIVDTISRAKPKADRIVVSLHWGDEFMPVPSPQQVAIAHRLVDAGADIILGHHPHVLQGIETYKGKLIAYSLGNFVFDQEWSEDCRRSIILNIVLSRESTVEYQAIPVRLNDYFQPVPLSGSEYDEAMADLEKRSKEVPADDVQQGNQRDYLKLVATIQKEKYKTMHRVALRNLRRLPLLISFQLFLRPILRRLAPSRL